MRYIYHISDIHLKETNDVNLKNSFNLLIEDMVKQPGILVVAGDIFENKTKFDDYEIDTFQYFMELLKENNIYTIIIPGNHDYNINSKSCRTILRSQCKHYENVHYISETSIHNVENVDFYIFSPIDKQTPAIQENNNIKIAILHETITGAIYDTGIQVTDQKYSVKDFSKFDYVLLGDIHKPQFLAPNVAYCGSFVQKNKGEGLDHGYILWDLEERVGRHVFIPLKEVFLKVTAADDEYKIPQLARDQKVTYISLEHKNCSPECLSKIKKELEQIAPINKICNKNIISQEKIMEVTAGGLNQNDAIRTILAGESSEIIEKVIARHGKELQNAKKIVRTFYQLNYMVWNNMSCYGAGNYIDFRTFRNNIVLIDGKNKSGKSSIIDILIFLLFNGNSRGRKEDIWNVHSKNCSAKLSFSVGLDEYVIEQCMIKKTNSHYLTKNGENITQSTIPETYKYMSEIIGIGTYDDFIQITTALQNRQFFVDIGKNQLFEFFSKMLCIDDIESVEKEIKKEKKAITIMRDNNSNKFTEIKTENDKLAAAGDLEFKISYLKEKSRAIEGSLKDKIRARDEIMREYNNVNIPLDLNQMIKSQEKKLENLKEFESRENDLVMTKARAENAIQKYLKIASLLKIAPIPILNIGELDSLYDQLIFKSYVKPIKPDFYENQEKYEEILRAPERKWEDLEFKYNKLKHLKPSCAADLSNEEMKLFVDNNKISVLDEKLIFGEIRARPRASSMTLERAQEIIGPAGVPNWKEIADNIKALEDAIIYHKMKFDDNCSSCAHNKSFALALPNCEKTLEKINKFETLLSQKEIFEDAKNAIDNYDYELTRVRDEKRAINRKIEDYKNELNYRDFLLIKNQLEEKNQYIENLARANSCIAKIKEYKNALHDDPIWRRICGIVAKYQEEIKILDNKILYQELKTKLIENLKLREIREHNISLDKIQKSLAGEIDAFLKNKEKIAGEIRELEIARTKYIENIKKLNEYKKAYKQYQEEINFLEKYEKCINSKTGIPIFIADNLCKILKTVSNTFLHRIADFELDVVYEDKGYRIYTLENGARISAAMASGYQKFIIDLVIRIALSECTTLSTTGFLFIDEGFSSSDEDNFKAITDILVKLKGEFLSLVLITHKSELKTFAEIIIPVARRIPVQHGTLTERELSFNKNSELEEAGCPAIIRTGPRAGQMCNSPVVLNGHCRRHGARQYLIKMKI